ncbi:MAG: type II toxin-antitoxin system VapC family toxin [Candidatus Binataceae bacterium]
MRVLLDTHAFLWWIADHPRLSPRARELISAGSNEVFFSVASAWEIAIKSGLGRIPVPAGTGRFVVGKIEVDVKMGISWMIRGEIEANGFEVLPVLLNHALHVRILPHHHRDPFDRMLVAQAQLEKLPIVTADRQIARYEVEVLW